MSRNSRKTHRNSRNNHNTNSGADTTKPSRVNKGRREVVEAEDEFDFEMLYHPPIRGMNAKQQEYINAINESELIFGTGAAGTGKTWIATAMAADMLRDKHIDRIILTRPMVEAGEKMGALPGEKEDKFAPYVEPFLDVFYERLGKSFTHYLIKRGAIVGYPIAFMRSKTFKNAWIICDEAQNTTPSQQELLLTRIGNGTKTIICGDRKQKDISTQSGLVDAANRLKHLSEVRVIEFGIEDCVRSGLVKKILRCYDS